MNILNHNIIPLFFVLCSSYAKTPVPVLMWSDSTSLKSSNLPKVSALQQISYQTFQTNYLNWFKSQNVMLFLQDALSVEDLSSHPKEMNYLNQMMEKEVSLFLPSVVEPSHLVHTLTSQGYNVINLEPGSSSAGLNLKDGKNLVVVKLPSTITNPSRSRALQKADEVVKSAMTKIGKKAEFTVIFTGKESSMEMQRTRTKRQLDTKISEETYKLPDGFHKTDCVLLYFRNDMTVTIGGAEGKLHNKTVFTKTADCQDESNSITINFVNVEVGDVSYSKINVKLDFEKEQNYWGLIGAELDISKENDVPIEHPLNITSEKEWLPIGSSYACSKQITFQSLKDDVGLRISGIQVQAFTGGDSVFGTSWDCVGFFSVPIWCGLLASLLSTVILLWGLYMLAEVRTMDRFDDPKGKSIMVPNTAE